MGDLADAMQFAGDLSAGMRASVPACLCACSGLNVQVCLGVWFVWVHDVVNARVCVCVCTAVSWHLCVCVPGASSTRFTRHLQPANV